MDETTTKKQKSLQNELDKYKAIVEFLSQENNMEKFREDVKKEVEKRGLDPNKMSDDQKKEIVNSVLMDSHSK